MNDSTHVDSARLLAHAAFVQGLARSLVGDRHAADDLAQDAWVAALERPPRDASNPRGWLATVLLNLRRQAQRGALRRRAREHGAARAEALPGTLDVLARASVHKELVLAVLALREPFRTVVLLRYFDALPPRAIAAQLDIPVRTVNSRLQRGLTELRAKLADAHGGSSAWMVALIPLARGSAAKSPWATTVFGALAMNAKWKIAAVLVLALAGVLGLRAALDDAPPRVGEVAYGERAASETSSPVTLDPLSADVREVARAPATTPIETTPGAVASSVVDPSSVLHGRVLDTDAQPIQGLRIAFRASATARGEAATNEPAALVAVSDARGAFEMPAPEIGGELVPDDPQYTAVLAGVFHPHASIEPVVVAARVRALAGNVRDESGLALRGARIELVLDAAFATRFAHVLDASLERDWRTASDEHGRFDLGAAPWIEDARLRTSLAGFHDDFRTLEHAGGALDITLRAIVLPEHHLAGDVRLSSGAPAEGARVAFGARTVETGVDGRFAFDLAAGEAPRVTAVMRGYLPAELEAAPTEPRWPGFVRLRLGATPLALAGRVVDARGEALAHVRVWIADPTTFGHVDGVPTQVENLLAGARSTRAQQAHYASGGKDDGRDLMWSWCETGADGRFRIDGLLPRDYRLHALDPVSLVRVDAGPFRAGAGDVEIRVPANAAFERVSGRVLAKNGDPIAGAAIEAVRRTVKIEIDGGGSISRSHSGVHTTTDAEGRFQLERVAREGIFLAVTSDRIVNTWLDFPKKALDEARERTDIEIRVVRRCHVQLELAGRTDRADEFAVLDGNGERMPLSLIRGDNDVTGPTVQLVDGRSPAVAVGEDAATLVLYSQDREIERQPITLSPNALTVLRP
ncbi:MAG: sigma-70 family RNA polymerase sigma factor [Planctomycetota bacterium]